MTIEDPLFDCAHLRVIGASSPRRGQDSLWWAGLRWRRCLVRRASLTPAVPLPAPGALERPRCDGDERRCAMASVWKVYFAAYLIFASCGGTRSLQWPNSM